MSVRDVSDVERAVDPHSYRFVSIEAAPLFEPEPEVQLPVRRARTEWVTVHYMLGRHPMSKVVRRITNAPIDGVPTPERLGDCELCGERGHLSEYQQFRVDRRCAEFLALIDDERAGLA